MGGGGGENAPSSSYLCLHFLCLYNLYLRGTLGDGYVSCAGLLLAVLRAQAQAINLLLLSILQMHASWLPNEQGINSKGRELIDRRFTKKSTKNSGNSKKRDKRENLKKAESIKYKNILLGLNGIK